MEREVMFYSSLFVCLYVNNCHLSEAVVKRINKIDLEVMRAIIPSYAISLLLIRCKDWKNGGIFLTTFLFYLFKMNILVITVFSPVWIWPDKCLTSSHLWLPTSRPSLHAFSFPPFTACFCSARFFVPPIPLFPALLPLFHCLLTTYWFTISLTSSKPFSLLTGFSLTSLSPLNLSLSPLKLDRW